MSIYTMTSPTVLWLYELLSTFVAFHFFHWLITIKATVYYKHFLGLFWWGERERERALILYVPLWTHERPLGNIRKSSPTILLPILLKQGSPIEPGSQLCVYADWQSLVILQSLPQTALRLQAFTWPWPTLLYWFLEQATWWFKRIIVFFPFQNKDILDKIWAHK